jgi:hypothetical protein
MANSSAMSVGGASYHIITTTGSFIAPSARRNMRDLNTQFHMLAFSENPLPWYWRAYFHFLYYVIISIVAVMSAYDWIRRRFGR